MQNMKHKLTFIVSLGIALILTAVIGATVSLHHCMKWDAYCDNGTLPSSAVKFTQNLIFHAYYWMGIAFICLCLVVAMLVWYFRHQQKLHPELSDMIADTSECEFKKIRVNRYTNEITIDGTTRPSRRQVATLLDYLLKAPTHEISFTELNTVFNENFFDGSSASKRKISNLKYEINDLLKNLGFELVKTSSDQFALTAKRKEVI